MDFVIYNLGQVTKMTPDLASPLLIYTQHQREGVRVSTDLTGIAPLLGRSSAVLGSNSWHAGHESVTLTTRLPRPLGLPQNS
ncbi:hypothetical protein TNCV_627691 [Trichonephila clavipes]|nr:hypothetical protein TNCV_627691 [Trichonephila clavipes]